MQTIQEPPKTTPDRKPFSSWTEGNPPKDYFRAPNATAAEFYQQEGYLVLDQVLTNAETDAIIKEAARICRNTDGKIKGSDPAPAEMSDEQVMQKTQCIHFPHKLSELMTRTLAHPAIVDTLTRVIGPNVKCMQSMLFFKAAGKPGQAWHQDEDYIPTRDRSLAGAWIALDDATIENGCLWIIPRSHKPGILWKQEWHGDRRFDCGLEAQNFPYGAEQEVPVEVKRGSIVFFNGYTLHRSLQNKAKSGYRRALVNHYMSAESFLPWNHQPGTSMAMQDYRDIVLVAGEDPYAWKGTQDLARPHIRDIGGGSGCLDWISKEPLPYHNESLEGGE